MSALFSETLIIVSFTNRPDYVNVHTRFIGRIPESNVATWIVVLSIICGILILFLIAMALYKVKLPAYVSVHFLCA
jgi:RsiW-degrading membrane proteinase PrsW (M82 family)